jgi:hypothetical protein
MRSCDFLSRLRSKSTKMKKFIPALIWAIIIAYLSFSCEKEYKQQDVPRGTIDTIYGLITVEHPSLDKFTMFGAEINGIYYRLSLSQTNVGTSTYVDTVFWVETPLQFVTSFKKF